MQEGNQASKESVQRAEHTDLSPLVDLRGRLLKAEGPDRELDAEICAALRYYTSPSDVEQSWADDWKGEWRAIGSLVHLLGEHGSGGNFRPAPLTASVDAALALVEWKQTGTYWGYRAIDMARELAAQYDIKHGTKTKASGLARFICLALINDTIATGADLMHGDDTGTGRGGPNQKELTNE